MPRLLAAVLLLAAAPARADGPPTAIPPKDFVEYWAAARVHARGGDPYDGTQLLPLQRDASGEPGLDQAVMLWTPPWTLPLYTPFGLLDPYPAHLAWIAVQLAAVLLSAWLVWRVYGPVGGIGWPLVPLLLAATFAPVWWLVVYGQNTGFVLLGLAGFLYLRRRGYPVAAGAVGALTAIKPHLLALFGLALVLDATVSRAGWRVLLGGVSALVVGSALAVIPDPDVFGQFARAMVRPSSTASPSVATWELPLPSYRLRLALGDGVPFTAQFIPLAVGAVLLVPYWWVRRRTWDWAVEVPRLVFASVLLAPYGGWIFDLTVLLVPIVGAFAWLVRRPRLVPIVTAASVHLLLSFATLLTPPLFKERFGVLHQLHHYIWVAPAELVWWAAVTRAARPAVNPPTGAGD